MPWQCRPPAQAGYGCLSSSASRRCCQGMGCRLAPPPAFIEGVGWNTMTSQTSANFSSQPHGESTMSPPVPGKKGEHLGSMPGHEEFPLIN